MQKHTNPFQSHDMEPNSKLEYYYQCSLLTIGRIPYLFYFTNACMHEAFFCASGRCTSSTNNGTGSGRHTIARGKNGAPSAGLSNLDQCLSTKAAARSCKLCQLLVKSLQDRVPHFYCLLQYDFPLDQDGYICTKSSDIHVWWVAFGRLRAWSSLYKIISINQHLQQNFFSIWSKWINKLHDHACNRDLFRKLDGHGLSESLNLLTRS